LLLFLALLEEAEEAMDELLGVMTAMADVDFKNSTRALFGRSSSSSSRAFSLEQRTRLS